MDYSAKVRVLRALRGVSQLDLAIITDIPNTYISNIETGKMLPSESWDRAIRLGLGWTPAVDAALDALEAAMETVPEEVPHG